MESQYSRQANAYTFAGEIKRLWALTISLVRAMGDGYWSLVLIPLGILASLSAGVLALVLRPLVLFGVPSALTALLDAGFWIEYYNAVTGLNSAQIASIFRKEPHPCSVEKQQEPHPKAAANRSSFSKFCDGLAKTLGVDTNFYQCSKYDQFVGRSGMRTFYGIKDLTSKFCNTDNFEYALHVLVDVDYYLDMDQFLLNHDGPVILYTFDPEGAADDNSEYKFCYTNDNKVNVTYQGGGNYLHELWDYNTDCLFVEDTSFRRCYTGATTFASYEVTKYRYSGSHSIVLLTPTCRLTGLTGLLGASLGGKRLDRFRPVKDNFVTIMNNNTSKISIGKVGVHYCVDMTEGFFNQIRVAAAACKTSPGLDMIGRGMIIEAKSKLPPDDKTEIFADLPRAAILSEYFLFYNDRDIKQKMSRGPIPPSPPASLNYYYNSGGKPENALKVPMLPFMSPIVLGATVPFKCHSNDTRGVSARVTGVKAKLINPTPEMGVFSNEFLKFLIPVPHMGVPDELASAEIRLWKPAQVQQIIRAGTGLSRKDVIKSFMKMEANSTFSDPRIISTMDDETKYRYSLLIYSLDDMLVKVDWYAFGKTPLQIADKVTDICSRAQSFVVCSDLSRMDGRVSNWLRAFELSLLLRWFGTRYAHEIYEMHQRNYNVEARTSCGVKYMSKFARLSGSPETSVMNTIANALMTYIAFRYMQYPAEKAWRSLGLFAGDDGICADIDQNQYEGAATAIGQKMEAIKFERNATHVNFLARFYGPGVWYGSPNSMCDIHRQLIKFHLTSGLSPDITPEMKLLEKARAYALTDGQTPIIGEYCTAVVQYYVGSQVKEITDVVNLKKIRRYDAYHKAEVQYPNFHEAWMDDYVSLALPGWDQLAWGWYMKQFLSRNGVENRRGVHLTSVRPFAKLASVLFGTDVNLRPFDKILTPPVVYDGTVPVPKNVIVADSAQIGESTVATRLAKGTVH